MFPCLWPGVKVSYGCRKEEEGNKEGGSLGLVIVEWYNHDEAPLHLLPMLLTAVQLFKSVGDVVQM